MRLALDWGEARIGVAACDRDGLLAYPVETVAAGPRALDRLVEIVGEYEPTAVIVGLPRTLAGAEGIAATKIIAHARAFAARVAAPVFLVDERLTTAAAAKRLHQAGRNAKKQRAVIDQAAAVGILDHVLAAERAGGARARALDSDIDRPQGAEHA